MKELVVITGASSGIGSALARRFAGMGHPLLLLSRRLEPMQALDLPDSLCRSVDVTDAQAVARALAEGVEAYGPVGCLINCAGIMLLGNSTRQPLEEWVRMMDVNVRGVLNTTAVVLPQMVARRSGTIINISSIAGRKTFDAHAVYCGSKFAVHAISESMRKEVSGSNVRVLVIAPGVVETPLLYQTSDADIVSSYEDWKRTIGGGLDARQIADCVAFAYGMPQDVSVREIVIAKTAQAD